MAKITEAQHQEKAVFVGVIKQGDDERQIMEYLDELEFLAETAGAIGVKKFIQKVDRPDSRTYIRSGKLLEIKEYCDRKYEFPDDERLFSVGAEAVQHKMKRMIEKAGVPKIRVHDIRHSHVSYLINQGVEPLIIKERLGHKDIKITMNTYGHLYPNQQKQVANLLDEDRNKKELLRQYQEHLVLKK